MGRDTGLHPSGDGSGQILSTSIDVETPMSNTSIRKHMQEQQRLQNIYLNFKNMHEAQIKQASLQGTM